MTAGTLSKQGTDKEKKLLATAADDDVPVRAGVAPAGVNREDDTGGDEDLADGGDPRGPCRDVHRFAGCIAQKEKSDHDHLRCGLGFAGGIGGKHGAVGERKLTQSGDEKIARDENDRGPCGNIMRPREEDKCGGDENFVGKGIHQPTEVGFATKASRNNTIEVVGKNGQAEGDGGHGGAPRHTAFPCGDEKDSQKEAENSELVGDGHGGKGPKVAKPQLKGKGVLTEEKRAKAGVGKDFLNVRLTALSDILRTWRSGPQRSLEKILRFFQKGG